MSDFLFSTRPGAAERLAQLLEHAVPGTAATLHMGGPWGSLACGRGAHDPPRVVVHGNTVVVLVGFPLLRTAERLRRVETEDDLRALAGLLAAGHADRVNHFGDLLDGPFALLMVDVAAGTGTVVTDMMSFIPVFAARRDGDVVLGTHVDAVAKLAGATAVDIVSATDVMLNESIAHPYTMYADVRVLEPASTTRIGPALESTPWWQPAEPEHPPALRGAAVELRDLLVDAVAATLADCESAGILFSAGEDARAVLGAAPAPSRVTAYIFAEWENREVRLARRAARAHGTSLVLGRRSPDHYLRNFDVLARLASSHHRFFDVHGWGFHDALGLAQQRVVLGGYSADTFLKGEYIGRRTPHTPQSVAGLRRELVAAVVERRLRHLARVRSIRPASAEEWVALWPANVRRALANLQGNRRLMRSYEPYMSNAIVRLAARVSQHDKKHRRLFHAAVRPLLHPSRFVPHVRSRFPYHGRAVNLVLGAGLNLTRGIYDRAAGLRGRQGGWTEPGSMLDLPALADLEQRLPAPGSVLAQIFEEGIDIERVVRTWHPRSRLLLRQQLALLA